MDLGPHATFIIAAYAAVAIVLASLIAWLVFDGFNQRRLLDELQARGARRRSASRSDNGAART